jgi:hypothetical protein
LSPLSFGHLLPAFAQCSLHDKRCSITVAATVLLLLLLRAVADWEEARCLKLLRLVHSRLPVGKGDV